MLDKPLTKAGSLLATVFVAGGIALAQQSGTQNTPPSAATGHYKRMVKQKSDQAFVNKAAEASEAQVKFGKLAEQKGNVQAVKDYGKQMVQEHSQFQQQLKNAASQANLNVPQNKMTSMEQRAYNHLSQLSGPAFDHAYAREVLRGHKDALAAFRTEAQNGQKQPIKQFAQNQISTLQSQLNKAQDLWHDVQPASSQGTSSSGSSSSR